MAGESSSAVPGRVRRRKSSKLLRDAGIVGQASWVSSNVNLVNTIIGAGTLAMPLAISHMGILLGTFFILWSALTAGFGLYLQARCARYLDRGTASFFALSQITYPNAAVVFDAAIAIKCFGVGVSYLIIIGDLMPKVIEAFNPYPAYEFLLDRHFWITAFMLVVIPLSFLRRLDSLKYTSLVALVSIGYLVILVIYHFFKGDTKADRGEIRFVRWGGPVPFLTSVPVIVFAYTCHQNMFSILNEIKDNSARQTTRMIGASIGSAAAIYVLVAIAGYLSFGNSVAGNIIGMYIPSVASTIGKAAIVILVIFSYPLQIHPCRASVDSVLKWRPNFSPTGSAAATATSPHHPLAASVGTTHPSPTRPLNPLAPPHRHRPDTIPELRFALLTTLLLVLSYTTAMSVASLSTVLAYVGSTGSTSISFILPGLFYHKISRPDGYRHQLLAAREDDEDDEADDDEVDGVAVEEAVGRARGGRKAWRRALLRRAAAGLAVYGVLVMVVCLVTNTFFAVAH